MSLLEVQDLSHSFDSQTFIFRHLNFQIKAGEFISFLGPSGSGKSTLLRILGGLQKPFQGEFRDFCRQKSFVFQDPRLLNWRTCLENALLPLQLQSKPFNEKKVIDLLKSFGLGEDINKFPVALSGGMKMRCALARSLSLDPDLLLFDEPFSALDESSRHRLQDELRALFETRKCSVIFVTHSIEEACFLSDRIFLFQAQGLTEVRVPLPAARTDSLRDQLAFFEAVTKIRSLLKEGLS
jgi:NitT/TauT family transport system ATP-binding protein